MKPMELARWQWSDYHLVHADRVNLWIHIVAVPLFVVGNLLAIALPIFTAIAIEVLRQVNGADTLGWSIVLPFLAVLPGLILSALAMAVQGKGHGREDTPPKPFTGPGNAIGRIFLEQWVTFPRFVLSGGWSRALRATRSGRT